MTALEKSSAWRSSLYLVMESDPLCFFDEGINSLLSGTGEQVPRFSVAGISVESFISVKKIPSLILEECSTVL